MRLSTKVLVIGGGPAGATAATYLAERGMDIILLEKNPSFVKPCGGGLSLSAFDKLQIPEMVIRKKVNSIRIVSPKGKTLDIDLKGRGLAIVQRGDFDRILREKAASNGAKVIKGEFLAILDDKKCRVEANIDEKRCEVSSEYIIASDGVNSRVRAALGIKASPSFFTVSQQIKDLNVDSCEFWFSSSHAPFSYSWVFPAAEGISAGTGCFTAGAINALFEKFKERRGIEGTGQQQVYRVPVWKGDLYNKNMVIFAGDSAGQVLPLTYEGIYYAMKAGELAAMAILEEKVDNYKRKWQARFQKRFSLMAKLGNYFLKDDASAEKLVSLHRRPEIQAASLRLWLMKDSSKKGLASYVDLFGKFLS
jgi:geranylgeranyl reductase